MIDLETEQQDYEERLRYRLKILSEQLKADKVKIASTKDKDKPKK